MQLALLPVFLGVLVIMNAPATMAADNYGSQVADKFARGLANAATGWVEIPKNIIITTNDSNIAVGMTLGVVKGAMFTIARTVAGALELATFYLPTNESIHPKYVWSNFNEESTLELGDL